MALKFTDANFEELVIKSDKSVLVDFWAEWCGPCIITSPVIDELAKEYEGKAVVGKVNVDDNRHITEKCDISSIPTTLFFKNGKVIDKQVGAVPKQLLTSKLDALMN